MTLIESEPAATSDRKRRNPSVRVRICPDFGQLTKRKPGPQRPGFIVYRKMKYITPASTIL